jgi:hypothetical protein
MPDTLPLAGALVAPHTHDDLVVGVHESGVEVVPAVSVFDFGLGFDVTEGPSGEANVALDLTESVWTFGQGGFRFRDGSGPLLATRASGDTLDVTGRLDVSSVVGIGSLADPEDAAGTRQAVRVAHETGDCTLWLRGAGIYVGLVADSATNCYSFGLTGEVQWTGAGAASYIEALAFNAIQNGANLNVLRGVMVNLLSYAGKGTIATSAGFEVALDYQGYKPTTFYGLRVGGHSGMSTVYGVRVEDFTGTTIRLLEVGPATPYLRLVGGAVPGANLTNLYLAEGVTPTLRRVQWKDGASVGAGDKVMVLA